MTITVVSVGRIVTGALIFLVGAVALAYIWITDKDIDAPRSRARQRAGSARRRVRAITATGSSWGRAAIARRIQGLRNLVPGAGIQHPSPVTTATCAGVHAMTPKVDSPAPEDIPHLQWWLTDEERNGPRLDYEPGPDMWSLLSEDTITRGMTAVTT